MSSVSDIRLFNPDKVGTMIVACPRFGSHYLELLVEERVNDHFKRWSESPGVHSLREIFADDNMPGDNDPGRFLQAIEKYHDRPGYHTVIINSSLPKIVLMTRPDILARWHVVRITHVDKLRWFVSWWLFFMHEKSVWANSKQAAARPTERFRHFGTSQETYDRALSNAPTYTLTTSNLWNIQASLFSHRVNDYMPADEQVDYADLKYIYTVTAEWKANQYPDIDLDQWFTNADLVRVMLNMYQHHKEVA